MEIYGIIKVFFWVRFFSFVRWFYNYTTIFLMHERRFTARLWKCHSMSASVFVLSLNHSNAIVCRPKYCLHLRLLNVFNTRTKPKFLEWLSFLKQHKKTTTKHNNKCLTSPLYICIGIYKRTQSERMEKLKCIKELVCFYSWLKEEEKKHFNEVPKQCTDWDSVYVGLQYCSDVDRFQRTRYMRMCIRFFFIHQHGLHLLSCVIEAATHQKRNQSSKSIEYVVAWLFFVRLMQKKKQTP